MRLVYFFILAVLGFSLEVGAKDLNHLREVIEAARSPYAGLSDREFAAKAVLSSIRKSMGEEFNTDEGKQFYEKVIGNPTKLKGLLQGKYQDIFSDFSALISQILLERSLKSCEDFRGIKQGILEASSEYSVCNEGAFSHSYVTWKSPKKGQVDGTEHSIPNFLYSSNLNDILQVSNHYHSHYGSENIPPLVEDVETIKRKNPSLSKDRIIELHGLMKLQNSAYQRSIFNAVRNGLSIEFQYNRPLRTTNEMYNRIAMAIEKFCKYCDKGAKSSLGKRLYNVFKKDLEDGKLRPKNHANVAGHLCQRLKSVGYPFSYNMQMKDLRPLSYFAGMGRAKIKGTDRQRASKLSMVAHEGGDGLLILTDSLTDMNKNDPAHTRLSCSKDSLSKDADLVKKAGIEAQKNAEEYITKVNEEIRPIGTYKAVKANLKFLMDTNPYSVGEALIQNPLQGPSTCSLLSEMKRSDDRRKLQEKVIIWGSAIVGGGLAVTGFLAPVGSALSLGALAAVTSMQVGMGLYEYSKSQEHKEKAELYAAAAFGTKNSKKMQISNEEFKKYQSAKISAMVRFGISAFDSLRTVKMALRAGKTMVEAIDVLAKGSIAKAVPSP